MTHPNGRRFLDARELMGLTQAALAAKLGVSQPTVSQIEKAERPLTADLVSRAAQATHLPESFFHIPPNPLDVCVPTFRKSSKAKTIDERRLVRLHREAARVFELASQQSGYHTARLPEDIHTLDEQAAAAAIRTHAGLGPTDPIPNMTRLLERLGFGVIANLDTNRMTVSIAHSGLSIPTTQSQRPLISTPHQYRGDAMRATLGHELGHHIWDQDVTAPSTSTRSPQERRAHTFASALLLPISILQERVTEGLNLNGYLPIKAEYGISVGAIIMSAKNNKIISPARARSLQIQLSARGWRTDEPVDVPAETPILFKQALERITHHDKHTAEALTGLPAPLLERWTNIRLNSTIIDFQTWRQQRATG